MRSSLLIVVAHSLKRARRRVRIQFAHQPSHQEALCHARNPLVARRGSSSSRQEEARHSVGVASRELVAGASRRVGGREEFVAALTGAACHGTKKSSATSTGLKHILVFMSRGSSSLVVSRELIVHRSTSSLCHRCSSRRVSKADRRAWRVSVCCRSRAVVAPRGFSLSSSPDNHSSVSQRQGKLVETIRFFAAPLLLVRAASRVLVVALGGNSASHQKARRESACCRVKGGRRRVTSSPREWHLAHNHVG